MNRIPFAFLLSCLLFFSVSTHVQAANFSVNDTASLIAAINTANANGVADTITLTSDIILTDVYETLTFLGSIGLPQITSNITINGNGFVIEREPGSSPAFRIITINGGTLTINDATIRNGFAADGLLSGGGNIILTNNSTLNLFNSLIENGVASSGAGILNFSGTMNIDNSRIQANLTVNPNQDGGGIYNNGVATITNSLIDSNLILGSNGAGVYNTGTMTITNSTISSNVAGTSGEGAGIYNDDTLTLNNVTITGNQTVLSLSSGIYNSGTVTVNNSIISGNQSALQLADCALASGTFTAPANNIFGVSGNNGGCTGGTVLAGAINTLLAPSLTNNGGPTETYALVPSSPAINTSIGGTNSDQRGAAASGIRDIGAYEFSSIVPTVAVGTVSASSLIEDGGVVTIPVTVGNLAAGNSLTIIANISGGTAEPIDYSITDSLTFNADGILNFEITGLADALIEGDETLTLSFSLVGAANIFGNGNQTVTIQDVVTPTFAKAFTPDTIAEGNVSTLTFTIDNTASSIAATSLDFTDNLPAGMVVASPANASTTCTGGTLTATSGTATIAYTGGTVPAGDTCTTQVDITSATSGNYVNTSGDLTSSLGNSGPASDMLTVNGPPTFAKAFAPDTIAEGNVSTLTFTIDNTASSIAATSLDFTDNLPAGMVVASPANASTTCTGGTLTANAGTSTITYTGGTVAAASSCTISVDITSSVAGAHVNTTGDLTSSLGNSGTASDTLTVVDTLGIGKTFVNDPVLAGATVDLQFTITNGDLSNGATGISFSDDLDATLTGLVAIGLPISDVCGIGSQISGTNLLTFTGGILAAGTSCSFTITLQVPVGAAVGDYLNTTSSVTGSILALPVVEAPATDTLMIRTSATIPSSPSSPSNSSNLAPNINVFDPAISKLGVLVPGQLGVQGEVLEWILTVSNTGTAVGTNVVVSDTLNPDLQIDSVNAPNATVNINGQTVTVTYATLNVGETVQFSIFTTVLNGAIVNNTACVNADNQGVEECATSVPIRELPSTGETPRWAYATIVGLGLLGLSMLVVLLKAKGLKALFED